jgi:anti-sigma factor RsiW
MIKKPCEEFADLLVDYIDGELPKGDSRRVVQHLSTCECCRQTAQALERSLGLATVIWSDDVRDAEPKAGSMTMPRFRRIRLYAVAASILIVALILVFTISDHRPQQRPLAFGGIDRQIARAGAAAELLAATEIIAKCEGAETIVERQYRFIVQEYAGTPAAESIRAQYGSRLGGVQ